MFPYFTLFGKTIGLYAVCALLGFAVCVFYAFLKLKKAGIQFEDVILLFLVAAAGIVVGGHLLYGITNIKVLIFTITKVKSAKSLWNLLIYCFGGGVFYGGFIGMEIALLLYLRRAKIGSKDYIKDVVAVCVPLFHTFGRIGCFFGGCCYGVKCSFGFITNNNTFNPSINGVRRFPTPLLEAVLNILIFLLLNYLLKRGKFKGHLVLIYMLIYPIVRFSDEFLRGDSVRGFLGPLSTSQWISIILFIYAAIRLAVLYRRKNA